MEIKINKEILQKRLDAVKAKLSGHEAEAFLVTKTENKNYLLAGLDEAGDNTDMLLLLSVNAKTGVFSLMQIPRDTYLRTEEREGKINQLYHYYASRNSKSGKDFSEVIAEALSLFGELLDEMEALMRDE